MKADLIEAIQPLRERLSSARRTGRSIGLVPTMGVLHAGHARLIEQARREGALVVVSIFVNPLQFDREDDLRRYPRTLEADLEKCGALGVGLVFAPSVEEMYPTEPRCLVQLTRIADHLCGKYRPGHFQGVATVVLKLFQIVQPERAYFGEKDAQQLAIVRRLVKDFNVPVTVVGVPTVREPDGLALSSRNRQLEAAERHAAPALYRALREAARQIALGERDAEAVKREARAIIPEQQGLRVEYLEIVDPEELQPVQRIEPPVVAAGAIWIGATRLIDNLVCGSALAAWPQREEDVSLERS